MGAGGCSSRHVLMLGEQTGISLIPLHMVPGGVGLRELCPSMPGKDAEGTREMTGCI